MNDERKQGMAEMAKWSGVCVAVAGLLGSVVDLYTEKAIIQQTSMASEEEVIKTLEELQAAVIEIDERVDVMNAWVESQSTWHDRMVADNCDRGPECCVDERDEAEEKGVELKAARKADRRRKRSMRSTPRVWQQQAVGNE